LEALDSDKNLSDAFPPEIPAIEKLEIMAEILIMFLGSLIDGIVTESLWNTLDQDMNSRANKLTDSEEIKTWVLDVLSASPNHNISFVFLTSMLYRVAGEIAPVPKQGWRESAIGSARSGLGAVRRSLSWKGRSAPAGLNDPAVRRREAVEKAYAGAFSNVIFRGGAGGKDRERRQMEERRMEILEAFVKGERDR
jgi:hypothetical protein